MIPSKYLAATALILALFAPTSSWSREAKGLPVGVAAQYDTTHVYVASEGPPETPRLPSPKGGGVKP